MEDSKKRRYFLKHVQINKKFVLIYILAISISIYLFLGLQINIWRFYGKNYCMLDCLHALENPYNFGMVFLPTTLFGILSGKKMYTYPAFILKYHDITNIWKHYWINIIVKSILFSFLFTVIACILSGLSSYTLNNWNEEESMFFQITETCYEGKTASVIFLFFVLYIIKCCLASAVLELTELMTGNSLWGVLLLGTVGIVEWKFEDISLFFHFFTISQDYFVTPWTIWIVLGVGCVAVVACYYLGSRIWKKKEFYGE